MQNQASGTDIKPKRDGCVGTIMLAAGVIFLIFTAIFCVGGAAVTIQDSSTEAMVPLTCMGIFSLGSGLLLIRASRRLGKAPEPEKKGEEPIPIPTLEQVELLHQVDEVKKLQIMSILTSIASDLTALRMKILGFQRQFPMRSMMGGPGVAQAEKQIPWIDRTLREAAEALTTGKDPFGNPITPLQTKSGLVKLISMVSDPEYLSTLDLIYEGIANPLKSSMQELGEIIEGIPAL